MIRALLCATLLSTVALASLVRGESPAAKPTKLVIAHRGASGYLPEHTLEAYALAYAQGADFIEPDVVLSRDGVLVCNHDITLNRTTDVAERFAERCRDDGRYLAIDFTLDELKSLRVKGGKDDPEPGYQMATLDELLTMVRRLNARTGRNVGTIPEPKQPGWHREQGQPIEPKLLAAYTAASFMRRGDPVIVQCFELDSLRRIRHELKSDLKLVFLAGESIEDKTLDELATFADGIGPSAKAIENDGKPVDGGGLVQRAHQRHLQVFPYTFDKDEAQSRRFLWKYDVDGLFTDFPDVAIRARAAGH